MMSREFAALRCAARVSAVTLRLRNKSQNGAQRNDGIQSRDAPVAGRIAPFP